MRTNKLKEFSKFLSGLVAGDFFVAWWLWSSGMVPVSFLGLQFTGGAIAGGMIFDGVIFLILVYYAWFSRR